MKIYNQDMTELIENPNLELGYLTTDWRRFHVEPIIVHHEAVEAVEEQGHFEILERYANGGIARQWIVDVPGVEAHEAYDEVIKEGYDDQEEVQVYIPYTAEELLAIKNRPYTNELAELKEYLNNTDYCIIKCLERGLSMEEVYPTEYQKRAEARDRINEIEAELAGV